MVVAVGILLPEHCCSNRSKPGWFWGPFWLFLMVGNQAGPKKDFFVKKIAIWRSTVVAVEIPLPEHCCGNGSKPRWVWGAFWLFLAVENPAGPKKAFSYKKMGIWGSTVVPPYALFFTKKIFFRPVLLFVC